MKKLMAILTTALLLALASLTLIACGGGSVAPPDGLPDNGLPKEFTGVTLADDEFTYDGTAHSLAVSGALPDGTTVVYDNNGKTDASVYTVTATLTKDGYTDKKLSATLTINKAQFPSGVVLNDKKFVYFDGKEYSLTVEGELPNGTTVTYVDNKHSAVGEYKVTATLVNPNYETKTLTATLTIIAKTDIALGIVNGLLDKPDPCAFLPEAFSHERMAYAQMPVGGVNGFATDTAASQIGKKSIGKQFHVLYEGLTDAAAVINKIDTVYAVGATIADAYQTFINNNPDNYAQFTGEVAGFKIKIILDDKTSTLLAGNGTVNIELSNDAQSETRTGRIQLTDGMAIKYAATANGLKFAVKTTVGGVSNLKQIDFTRNGDTVAGYLREFTGTETKNLKTTGVIASDAQKTIIMSDKRETDDMVINGYEEVYSSVTGELIGGEVKETIKVVDYDTLWLHLADVTGINSVRVTDEQNGLNADSVYVNGATETFKTKKVNPIIPTSSRMFDIKMKEVWYVVKETTDGKTSYKTHKTLVPMLFVQKEQTDAFADDLKSTNGITATLPAAEIQTVKTNFESLQALFDAAKQEVTYESIDSFIGEKHEFFA